MKWRNSRVSRNVEDRRSQQMGSAKKMGGLGVAVVTLAAMYFGINPKIILGLMEGMGAGGTTTTQNSNYRPTPEQQELAQFTGVVVAETEDAWNAVFQQEGMRYQEPKLVLFTDRVNSACGNAEAAMGPFYCPGDKKIYIDLGFYQQLKNNHNAPGDFSQAYVIAHEVGHHVQNLLGISDKVQNAQRSLGKVEGNQLSVRLELQADCFAGVWAHRAEKTKHILEEGDIEEALNAASAIGDDRLQKQARGYASPESFTHGSSKQRVEWFKKGLLGGSIQGCNTFG